MLWPLGKYLTSIRLINIWLLIYWPWCHVASGQGYFGAVEGRKRHRKSILQAYQQQRQQPWLFPMKQHVTQDYEWVTLKLLSECVDAHCEDQNDWKFLEGARTPEVLSGAEGGFNPPPPFCKLRLEEVKLTLFALRILRDGAKRARLINSINFSRLLWLPLFYFQIFSQSIFTKNHVFFSFNLCDKTSSKQ